MSNYSEVSSPDHQSSEASEIDDSRAPLVDHLIELRTRLLYSIAALFLAFLGCFLLASPIFNILLQPYIWLYDSAEKVRMVYTAPQEYFFTQIKLSFFGAFFIAFPVIAMQLYIFIAPGLYKNERRAFLPYLLATPVLFLIGATVVYFLIIPMMLSFFLGMQQSATDTQAEIEHLPKVSEYLDLIITLIFAFGLTFQLPVVLTLLGRAGLVTAAWLRRQRKFAIVAAFAAAAILTPPDPLSQIALAVPTVLLYEVSIWAVAVLELRSRRQAGASPG